MQTTKYRKNLVKNIGVIETEPEHLSETCATKWFRDIKILLQWFKMIYSFGIDIKKNPKNIGFLNLNVCMSMTVSRNNINKNHSVKQLFTPLPLKSYAHHIFWSVVQRPCRHCWKINQGTSLHLEFYFLRHYVTRWWSKCLLNCFYHSFGLYISS